MAKLLERAVWFGICISLLIRSCFSTVTCGGGDQPSDFPYCEQLDDGYVMYWRLMRKSVMFQLQINKVDGWFALGRSETGAMRGSDMWVFKRLNGADEWTAVDGLATGTYTPRSDKHQDVTFLSWEEVSGVTTVIFTRQLETCDIEEDNPIYPDQIQPYVFAYGDTWQWHSNSNRGTKFIRLADTIHTRHTKAHDKLPAQGVIQSAKHSATAGMPFVIQNGSDDGSWNERGHNAVWEMSNMTREQSTAAGTGDAAEQQLDVLMPHVTIPTNKSGYSYLCAIFQAPKANKHHIIAVAHKLDNPSLTHHMKLFACYTPPHQPLGSAFFCEDVPASCSNLYLIWVPGQPQQVFRPPAGFPFGQGSYEYLMLQVHYINPIHAAGVQDNSGFLLTHTPTLRPHDMGTLQLGVDHFLLPGGRQRFTLPPNICPAECLSKITNATITLTSTLPYMRASGLLQTLQHLRPSNKQDWTELLPPYTRRYFDPQWAGATPVLPGAGTILPTDALITTCSYHTTDKAATASGPSAQHEQCYNWVHYWPAQDINLCQTVRVLNGSGVALCSSQLDFERHAPGGSKAELEDGDLVDLLLANVMVTYDAARYGRYSEYYWEEECRIRKAYDEAGEADGEDDAMAA